ncbi:LysR family transcriptional regulator ArgP [Pseudonocardia spinosispora]|uniref:LysR family transcriptional regulator ArgP n=1 Tax=Pseudonocardia spinosispora TaxID=103441 RepID=UPI00055BEED0|nr:LysR family transcriptional regulator ArgP [Pseudonocardia spinosispora]
MTELPLDQVRTLLTVVDEGTFDAAAAALHLTPSAISQRVKALEQRTGRVLLIRSKPVRLTESGQVVARFARQVARLERDALGELGMSGADEPSRLSIAVNADSLATWFLPALTRVPEHLRVCFELHREDQDHTAALLREGLVAAAVTSAPDPVQGCSVRALGNMRYRAVASPAFIARHLRDWPDTSLRTLLPTAPVVIFNDHDDLQDRFARSLGHRNGVGPLRHYVPSSEGFVDAVSAGMGWGMLPMAQAGTHLSAGTLIDLAPETPIDVPLYWQQWKLDSPALAATADAVSSAAREALT